MISSDSWLKVPYKFLWLFLWVYFYYEIFPPAFLELVSSDPKLLPDIYETLTGAWFIVAALAVVIIPCMIGMGVAVIMAMGGESDLTSIGSAFAILVGMLVFLSYPLLDSLYEVYQQAGLDHSQVTLLLKEKFLSSTSFLHGASNLFMGLGLVFFGGLGVWFAFERIILYPFLDLHLHAIPESVWSMITKKKEEERRGL